MGLDLFLRQQGEVRVWQGCGSTCDLRICLNEHTAALILRTGGFLPLQPGPAGSR